MIRPTKRAASNQPRRRSGRVRCRDAKGVMFNFAPHSRDALTRATAVAGHAFACHRGCGTRFRVPPRLRDTLSRGFWIFNYLKLEA